MNLHITPSQETLKKYLAQYPHLEAFAYKLHDSEKAKQLAGLVNLLPAPLSASAEEIYVMRRAGQMKGHETVSLADINKRLEAIHNAPLGHGTNVDVQAERRMLEERASKLIAGPIGMYKGQVLPVSEAKKKHDQDQAKNAFFRPIQAIKTAHELAARGFKGRVAQNVQGRERGGI